MLFHSYCTSSSPLAGGLSRLPVFFVVYAVNSVIFCNIVEFIQTDLFKLVEYTWPIRFSFYACMKTKPNQTLFHPL